MVLISGVPILFPGQITPLSWHVYWLLLLLLLSWFDILFATIQRLRRHYMLRDGHTLDLYTDIFTPLTSLHFVFFILLIVAIWVSSDQISSLYTAGYLVFALALHRSLLRLPGIKDYPLGIFSIFTVCGLGLALITPFILIWRAEMRMLPHAILAPFMNLQGIISGTVHPNVVAGALILIIPVSFAVLLQSRWHLSRFFTMFQLVATTTMAAAVILTQSRGGLLGLSAAILLICFLLLPRTTIWLALLIVLFVAGSYIFGDWIKSVWLARQESLYQDVMSRFQIWQVSIIAIIDFPLTGIGIGTFTTVIPLLYPLSFSIESYPHAHNLFLQIGLDLGIPGLTVYVALLTNLFAMIFVTFWKTPRHSSIRTLAIGSMASLVAMLIHGMVDAVTWGTKLSFFPWILFALITQMFLLAQKPTHKFR